MRTSIVVSTFLLVGAGAVSASALNATGDMKGSDTIFEVTTSLIAHCPGATGNINYQGGGSGTAETQMKAGAATQQIGPMSKFVSTCSGSGTGLPTGWTPAGTESGIVIGLDGVDIVANKVAGGATGAGTCNPNANCANDATAGLAQTGKVIDYGTGTYTISSWSDVLAVLFAGMDHTATAQSTANGSQAVYAARDCNSPLRNYLAQNYKKIFQSDTCGGSCAGGIQHLFRRDDLSGTTDVFRTLLSIPQPDLTNVRTPFCNALIPNNFASPQPAKRTWWNTAFGNSAAVPQYVNVYAADFQDFDPIRVACAGTNNGTVPSKTVATEQVCGREGNLGLVLTVVPTDKLAVTDSFPTTVCGTGKTKLAAAPLPLNFPAGNTYYRCPSGDQTVLAGQCLVPTDSSGSTQCLAGAASRPGFVFDNKTINGITVDAIDGRVYNAHLHGLNAGGFNYQLDTTSREIYGAFYRIHSTRSMVTSGGDTSTKSCVNQDATSQIGCLVAASPCSLAFAGGEAVNQNPDTGAVAAKGIAATTACVSTFSYPMARKLYANTLIGFGSVTDPELSLAKCFAKTEVPALLAPNDINSILTAKGFIPNPSVTRADGLTYAGGPFCEDFNEGMLCSGVTSNSDACNPGGAPVLAFTTPSTTCGNGVVEQFEECDDGTVSIPSTIPAGKAGNGSSSAACTKACRLP